MMKWFFKMSNLGLVLALSALAAFQLLNNLKSSTDIQCGDFGGDILSQPASAVEYISISKTSITSTTDNLQSLSETFLPSILRPFIFFHIPKCAGSTLRNAIDIRAKSFNKTTFVPCVDGVPCPTTEGTLSTDSSLAERAACAEVFLGHFRTALVGKMAEIDNIAPTSCKRSWNPTAPLYDCLTAIREPISRTISHYYHFLQNTRPEYNDQRLKDLSLEELQDVIGSSGGNVMLDYLSSYSNSKDKMGAATAMLSRCVVTVVEDWDMSAQLIEARYPWLRDAVSAAPAKNAASSKHESVQDLTSEQIGVFDRLLPLDMQLYREGVEIYKKQLRASLDVDPGVDLSKFSEHQSIAKHENSDSKAVESHYSEYPFIKAVTYFGRNNPLTFWNSDRLEDHIREDFSQFVAEGFNAIILMVPWAGFQLSVVPPSYDKAYLERLEYILDTAAEFNLFAIMRVSYPHDYNPENSPPGEHRCELTMVEEQYAPGIRDGWLDYLKTLDGILTKPKFEKTYMYSYFSWEDFFCLIGFMRVPEEEKKRLTEQLGLKRYVKNTFSYQEIKDIFGPNESDIIIPREGRGRPFEVYIDFMSSKWWALMEQGRNVHRKLSMEMRVDTEPVVFPDGTKRAHGYDLHLDDEGPPRQLYWSSYVGNEPGAVLTPETMVQSLNHVLSRSTSNGKSPTILGQFNYLDNTPGTEGFDQLPPAFCGDFLKKAASVLTQYTRGYGLWAYRNYRQSEIFNGSFLRDLQGWETQKAGNGHASIGSEGYLLLSGGESPASFVSVKQMARQLSSAECDGGNNEMEVCFRLRSKQVSSRVYILWNHTDIQAINSTDKWEERCIHLPAFENPGKYPLTFKVPAKSLVEIDSVEFFCRKLIAL
jgi:hypothetical protein